MLVILWQKFVELLWRVHPSGEFIFFFWFFSNSPLNGAKIGEIIRVKANFGIVVEEGVLNNILKVLMCGVRANGWRGV